jgi:hypothetical protein
MKNKLKFKIILALSYFIIKYGNLSATYIQFLRYTLETLRKLDENDHMFTPKLIYFIYLLTLNSFNDIKFQQLINNAAAKQQQANKKAYNKYISTSINTFLTDKNVDFNKSADDMIIELYIKIGTLRTSALIKQTEMVSAMKKAQSDLESAQQTLNKAKKETHINSQIQLHNTRELSAQNSDTFGLHSGPNKQNFTHIKNTLRQYFNEIMNFNKHLDTFLNYIENKNQGLNFENATQNLKKANKVLQEMNIKYKSLVNYIDSHRYNFNNFLEQNSQFFNFLKNIMTTAHDRYNNAKTIIAQAQTQISR